MLARLLRLVPTAILGMLPVMAGLSSTLTILAALYTSVVLDGSLAAFNGTRRAVESNAACHVMAVLLLLLAAVGRPPRAALSASRIVAFAVGIAAQAMLLDGSRLDFLVARRDTSTESDFSYDYLGLVPLPRILGYLVTAVIVAMHIDQRSRRRLLAAVLWIGACSFFSMLCADHKMRGDTDTVAPVFAFLGAVAPLLFVLAFPGIGDEPVARRRKVQ